MKIRDADLQLIKMLMVEAKVGIFIYYKKPLKTMNSTEGYGRMSGFLPFHFS